MKKLLAVLLLGAMVFMFAACGAPDNGTETPDAGAQDTVSQDVADQDGAVEGAGAGMGNPWTDSDEAGVLEATGFDLVAPEEAVNVAYSYMESAGMAQMNYTMENAMWVYRVQPTDALEDISGISCEWDSTEATKVAGMDAMEYAYAEGQEGDSLDDMQYTRVINWYDADKKVTYSLSVIGSDLNGMDTVVYAENLYKLSAK